MERQEGRGEEGRPSMDDVRRRPDQGPSRGTGREQTAPTRLAVPRPRRCRPGRPGRVTARTGRENRGETGRRGPQQRTHYSAYPGRTEKLRGEVAGLREEPAGQPLRQGRLHREAG